MGKRIKSTGVILDASSTGSAPVSPAGTVALRAKSDSTQFQYSANGGVWTDFTGGAASTPRLDQVLDPDIPATDPPTNRVKTFSMTDHSLAFAFTATQSEECFVITSLEPVTPGAAGSILLIQARGATTEKNPLRIETRGVFAFTVASTGKVAIGAETAIDERLNIYQTNTGSDNSGLIFGGCTMTTGSTATSVRAVAFQLDDSQDTASLLSMKTLELELIRTGGVANTNVTATVLDFDINIGRTTKTVRGLTMGLSCVGTLTVTDWEGIRITAPSTVGSPTITNKRAIITESGAGNVGFGTLTPAVQLHVSGAVQIDQALTQYVNVYKSSDTDEHPALIFNRAKGTGSTDVTTGHGCGAVSFRGRLSGTYTQLGYVRCFYDSTDIGVTEFGSGAVDLARVKVTQSATIGAASLIAAPYQLDVKTGGFVFSHGTTGSIYYKAATGFVVNLDIVTSPSDVGKVLTVTDVSGSLLPRWVTSGAGSGPVGSATELQYRVSSSAFGAVSGTRVSGTQVWWTGSNSAIALNVADTVGSLDDRNLRSERTHTLTSGTGYNVQLLTTLSFSSSSSATFNGIDNRTVISSTAASTGSVYGDYTQVTLSAAQTMASLVGIRGRVNTNTTGANITSLMAGYFSADRGSSGTTTTSRALYATLSSGLGTTTTGYGLDVYIDNPSGSIGTAYGVNVLSEESGGTLGTVYGLYIDSSGTFTANYGVIVTSNVTASGFGITNPSATLHASGTVRFDLGSDGTGDIYYRSSGGSLTRLGVGTNTHVLTLTGGLPTWAAPTGGGGGGTPASPVDTLQFNNAGAFGSVTSSVVSGANVTLGGILTLSAATALNHIIQKTTHVADGTDVAQLIFRGDRSGVPTDFGYFRAYWKDLFSSNAVIEMGKSTNRFFGISEVVAQMQFDTQYVQLQSTGISVSTGTNGGVFIQNATGFFVSTAAGTSSQYLKGGTVPSWGSLDATHVTAGTLALARGGTGSSLTDPNVDRILFWDDSAGAVTWLEAGSGLTITGTVMTASGGGGSPTGSSGTLQYNNAGAFGAVANSSVDGNSMITLSGGTIGQLTLQNDTQTALYLQHASTSNYPGILFSRARGTWASKSAVLSGDSLAVFSFGGYYDSSNSRTGGEILLSATANWSTSSAPTVFRVKTTHINQNTPRERMVLGASKDMTDNTLTDLFTITFGTTDQIAGGGELHVVFVAKQVSGTVATQVYRRKFSFIAGHNGATNTSMFHLREDNQHQASAGSTGSITAITHAINADAAVAIATAIPASPNLIATNVITYKILANSSLTTFSQFTVYYHIIYHGEITITLA